MFQAVVMLLVFFFAINFAFGLFSNLLVLAATWWPLILAVMVALAAGAAGMAHARGRPVPDAALAGFFWPLTAVLKGAFWLAKAAFSLVTGSARGISRGD